MRGPLLALLLVLPFAALRAEGPAAPPAPSTFTWRSLPNTAFGPGESLLFTIKYGFITGGSASLEVRSTESVHGREAFRIVSEARTNSGLDVFFKVRDLNESWMDAGALCSHRYHQVMREGRHFREVESRFDQANGTFVHWHKGKKSEGTETGALAPFSHDILSSLYFLRTVPLVPGRDVQMSVNSGGKSWTLSVKVKGVEKVKVPAGTFTCLRVEPLISGDGLFLQTGNLEVWMTDDARRMPVLMRSKVMVGAFTAELAQYDFQRAEPRSLLDK